MMSFRAVRLVLLCFMCGILSLFFVRESFSGGGSDEKIEDGTVLVRVWSLSLEGGANVGHVSLETKNRYMSLWPDEPISSISKLKPAKPTATTGTVVHLNEKIEALREAKAEGVQVLSTSKSQGSYDSDLRDEGRKEEKRYPLYGMNTARMDAIFDGIISKGSPGSKFLKGTDIQLPKVFWYLFGAKVSPELPEILEGVGIDKKTPVYSCATFAMHLLEAGGLDTNKVMQKRVLASSVLRAFTYTKSFEDTWWGALQNISTVFALTPDEVALTARFHLIDSFAEIEHENIVSLIKLIWPDNPDNYALSLALHYPGRKRFIVGKLIDGLQQDANWAVITRNIKGSVAAGIEDYMTSDTDRELISWLYPSSYIRSARRLWNSWE